MVLKPGREEAARAIFEKWGVDFAVIGRTTDSGRIVIRHRGVVEAEIPLHALSEGAPNYDRPHADRVSPAPLVDPVVEIAEARVTLKAPGKSETDMKAIARAFLDDRIVQLPGLDAAAWSAAPSEARLYARLHPGAHADFAALTEAGANLKNAGVIADFRAETHRETVDLADRTGAHSLLTALGMLMGSPALASRRWIFDQYDSTVMADTVIGPGGDAALVRVHGTNRALALTADVTPRYVAADPFEGAKQAVAETYRNICATGAAPLAITNCLNFGNPERPEIMAELVGAIEGIAEACEGLNYPVVSGNVSLYNETNGVAIPPTPAIGGVGVLDDATRAARVGGAAEGDELIAVGVTRGWLGRSLYLRTLFNVDAGAPPPVDLAAERRNGETIRKLIADGLVTACHDVSDGGLLVAAAEMALAAGEGLDLKTPVKARRAAFWLGEDQARYLVACAPGASDTLLLKAAMAGVQASKIGRFGGAFLRLDDHDALALLDLADIHERPLADYMAAASEEEKPAMPMTADAIKAMILESLPDATVEIEDLAGDGDHYRARIVSAAFNGKNRVQQHQMIYRALKGKMGGELHALALETEAAE